MLEIYVVSQRKIINQPINDFVYFRSEDYDNLRKLYNKLDSLKTITYDFKNLKFEISSSEYNHISLLVKTKNNHILLIEIDLGHRYALYKSELGYNQKQSEIQYIVKDAQHIITLIEKYKSVIFNNILKQIEEA